MSNSGFIPFSRKIFDHKFWQESRDYSKFEAWVDLIQLARYDSAIQQIHTYGVCELGRGQLVASIRFLSKRWGWSEKRVRNFMEHLEREKMIEKELHNGKKEGTTTEKNGNEKGTQKGTGITIVTICNYDHYNSLEDKRGTVKGKERAQQGHSRGTRIKKDNKGNKDNTTSTLTGVGMADGVPPPPPTPDPLESAFAEFQKWIKEHAPRVAKMKEPFTITQYRAVKTKFAPKLVADTLRSMHNYEPLLVKNRSANLTFRKWAEKDKQRNEAK